MAVLYTITVNEDVTPLDGADVWVTTDSGGADTVASGVTNALGQKSFTLDLGSYYVWAQRAGTDIANPTAITVTVSGGSTITGTPASGGSYITVAGLKRWLGITGSDVDTMLTEIVSGVCAQVDAHCGRRFGRETSTRYFDPDASDWLPIDDLISVTSLASDNGNRTYAAWAVTDYELEPINASAQNEPYTTVYVAPNGRYAFPAWRRGVQITGVWGWPAVPAPVVDACYLQAERIYQRRNSPMGVAGPNEFGQLTALAPLDPDVRMLLQPYVRMGVRGI